MIKSPEEIAEMRLEWAQQCTAGLRAGNPGLGTSLQQALESWLSLGLVQWRRRLAHPRAAFESAISARDSGFTLLLAEAAPEIIWQNFLLEKADVLRLLLGQSVDSRAMEDYVERSIFDDECRTINVQLAISLARKAVWGEWNDILNGKHSKRDHLFFETFHCYHDALSCHQQGNTEGLVAAIENCAQCYLKRKKDKYYAQSVSSEGGGQYNDYMVDFYLSALIKQLLPASELPRLSEIASIHVFPE